MSGHSLNKYEINCLYFEAVCSKILFALNIPTADIALVTIAPGSFKEGDIIINKRTLREGTICLGFKEIERSDLVTNLFVDAKASLAQKLINLPDLLKMAVFDLWTDNRDRKNDNYNLLLQAEEQRKKLKLFAIDHAVTFGGLKLMRVFHEDDPLSIQNKLFSSQFFQLTVKQIDVEERANIVKSFAEELLKIDVATIAVDTHSELPEEWGIDNHLPVRVAKFLSSYKRLTSISGSAISYLKNLS